MKLDKIILTIVLVLSICFCQFAGCGDEEIPEPGRDPTYISFAEWDSQFTEEQHIANIESRAQGLLLGEYANYYKSNPYAEHHSYKVYLIYSLDETPRFFMVEWFSYNSIDQIVEYSFFDFGFIYQDEYYFIDAYNYTIYSPTLLAKSIFRTEKVLDYKMYLTKYFCAYRDGENLICIEKAPGNNQLNLPDYKEVVNEERKDEFIIDKYWTTYKVLLKYQTQK